MDKLINNSKCPRCGSVELISDLENGETVCSKYGLVIDEDTVFVNQVVNYDHWLDNQPVKYRAGFVLALEELSNSLPSD